MAPMVSSPRSDAPNSDAFVADRAAILEAALARAPFEGWTPVMLRRAAEDAGRDRAVLAAAFPNGVSDVLRYWSVSADRGLAAKMAGEAFAALKVREKVTFGVWERLQVLRPHKEAARRAAATLALPVFAPLGAELAWKTCDAIWRGLNDASTDFNYYTKRATLMAVWTSTFARWLADESADETPTREFLARRIDNVMQFEKVKAQARKIGVDPEGMFGWLARMRYPQGK
jgi:ubiquinone biosynthesis protein COQ9